MEATNIKPEEVLLIQLRYGKENAISTKELINRTGIQKRYIKILISRLREDYPICSSTTNGGGYWIAKDGNEIGDYIKLIQSQYNQHALTIHNMYKHLIGG